MAKKTGLGRGLNSLISESITEVGLDQNPQELEISKIFPNENQPRTNFNDDELKELSDSIQKVGVLQPLLVRRVGEKYQIIAGERRYQAAKMAGINEVPVLIRDINDEKVLELALIENLQRSDLDPIEEAFGYKTLLEQNNMTQEELARAVSKSRSTITNAIRLLDLPSEIQHMLIEKKLSAGHARAILSVPSTDARIRLANKVVDERLSVRQTESLAPLYSVTIDAKSSKPTTPRSFKIAARQLRLSLDTNVRVKSVRGKNKIEIEFKDEEDLSRIVEMIEGMKHE